MPRISRWFLSSSLAWLILASLLGTLLVARPVLIRAPALDALRPLIVHVLVMGFLTQAVVAILLGWGDLRRHAAGNVAGLAWGSLILLDAGLALRVVSEPMLLLHALPPWGSLVFLSGILEALAAVGIVGSTWPSRQAG